MVKMCLQLLFALVVALQMGSNLVEAHYLEMKDGWEEDGGAIFASSNIIKIPQFCKGKPFCFEKGEKYPDEMIDRLVKNLRDMELEDPEARISSGSRSGNGATESECKANFNDSLIYYITDTNNKERVVVQSKAEGHFRQNYNLRWCSEEGRPSNTPHFLKRVNCVTKTMDLDFFVLNENEISEYTKITVATAKIPVCCRCELDTK